MELTYTLASVTWPDVVWKRDRREVEDELQLTIRDTEQGWYADFSIRWIDLGDRVTPEIRAFNDSWYGAALILQQLQDFNEDDPTPQMVIAALEDAGWRPSEYHGQKERQPIIGSTWDCSTMGHVLTGVGTGTGVEDVVWNRHCDRCGAALEPPQ